MSTAKLPPGTVSAALEYLYPAPDPYTDNPAAWVREKLGGYLWSKQIEILESVRDNPLTAVKAAHDVSKSHTASCAIAWWESVHEIGQAFAITTAPSYPQVEAILWREIRRRHREGRLPGRITLDCKWHMGDSGRGEDEELIAIGRKPADYDEYTFQGIHARYLLAVLDEAGGVPEWLWNAVLALATNENARILAIGNPDDPNSHFAQICKPGSGWNVISISVWDSPNFTDEEVPDWLADELVSPAWVEARRIDWGEGSPIWLAKVDGEFPDISDEYLIAPSLLEKCFRTDLPGLEDGRYGVDIARMGTDKSVIYRNRGGQIRLVKSWAKKDTMQSAGEIAAILKQQQHKYIPAVVDIIGLGAGVYDRLKELTFNVAPFQGSERAHNPPKFKNRRAETWWTFRELMEAGLIDLDPNDTVLAAHLGSVKWGVDSSGRIYVEGKDDLRERGLPSPDHADAAILSTVAVQKMPRPEDSIGGITGDLLTKIM
jgi:hypothetical protein